MNKYAIQSDTKPQKKAYRFIKLTIGRYCGEYAGRTSWKISIITISGGVRYTFR